MHRKHRIAVVIPKYGLMGGAEGFAAELTKRISDNHEYELHVFANNWTADRQQITYHKVPILMFPKYLTTISFAYLANLGISKLNFDLIHTHDRIFNADLFTMHSVPHRFWVREVRQKKRMSLFDLGTEWVEKKLVTNRRCRFFHAVSNLTKEKFLQEYPFTDPGRVRVIHPGIEIGRYQRCDRYACRREMRSRYDIGLKDTVIFFASMNLDIRGLDELMRALARLGTNRLGGVKLLVAGKGNEKKYAALARSLGIREKVIFAGIADRNTLKKMYLACDIFCILSSFDTFSMSSLEAMAASLPVIISSNVGAKDLVEEGVNGFVIRDTNDSEKIANRIEKLMDESIRTRMAEEAFKTASDHTWEKTAQKIEEIYDEILISKNSP